MSELEPAVTAALDFSMRLDAVERRLAAQAGFGLPPGLADPDPGAEERWDAGQIWAHLAEFPPFWLAQLRAIVAAHQAGTGAPVPFGRTKRDASRLEPIERDRAAGLAVLWPRVQAEIGEVRAYLEALPPAAWGFEGLHPTRGVMLVAGIVEEMLVGHLEEHATQLEGLEGGDDVTAPSG